MKAYLIRVNAAKRTLIGLQSGITPRIMQRLMRSKVLVQAEVGRFDGKPVHYTRALTTYQEAAILPRWQLGNGSLIAGDAILFGINAAGRAASCPGLAKEIAEYISWHPPIATLGMDLSKL